MEPLSLFLLVGGAAAAFLAYRAHRTVPELEARLWRGWHAAAGRVGLEVHFETPPPSGTLQLRARCGSLEVFLESPPPGAPKAPGVITTRITVTGLGHGLHGLTVRRETGWAKLLGGLEIELGAPAFDDAFAILGDSLLVQAVLDSETRSQLGSLLRGTLRDRRGGYREVEASLAAGVLKVTIHHSKEIGADELADLMTDLFGPVLDLALRLVEPEDVAGRLAGNLGTTGRRSEPEEGVRLRSLRYLLRDFREHPATEKTLLALRDDPSTEVRLEVAIARGKAGQKTLLALVTDAAAPDGHAARAVRVLGAGLPFDVAEATLHRSLEAGRSELAKACLEALGRLGRADSEHLMVAALASQGEGVALTATQALGRVGTIAAVPALRQLEERGSRELSRAARQAIAEIQSRLTGAEHGQLSLADAEAGALSLVTAAEPGRLSLAQEPSGPQSEPASLGLRSTP